MLCGIFYGTFYLEMKIQYKKNPIFEFRLGRANSCKLHRKNLQGKSLLGTYNIDILKVYNKEVPSCSVGFQSRV